MARFHESRFDPNRFDSTPAVALRPPYLKQEHAQDRITRAQARRRRIVSLHVQQRNRQRPPTAWIPQQNEFGAYPRHFVPWRMWTIRR